MRQTKANFKLLIIKLSFISAIVYFLIPSVSYALAASCPTGGSVALAASCEMPATASYTDLTIPAGVIVTAPVGQKIDITATGTVTINAGGGIDVSGIGNNSSGVGANGTTNGSACIGVFGSGGGGGGYGGAGGKGGDDAGLTGATGGVTYGSAITPFDLGSPGGLGGGNVSGNGMGGGAVKITAQNLVLSGFIIANGTAGSDPRANDGSGAGGGGSGGSIWLVISGNFNASGGSLEAKGGNGGTDVNCGGGDGGGGGGGGGRINWQYGTLTGTVSHTESGGTGGFSGGVNGNVGTSPIPPTCSIFASPSTIDLGDNSTLSWTTTDLIVPPNTAVIDNGVGPVGAAGSKLVSPITGTTYTLTVTNVAGSATCNASVSINGPSCTLIADSPVVLGDATSLDWTASNADGGSINPGSITLAMPPNTGSAASGPITGATTFTMSVTGPGGTSTCSSAVTTITPPVGGIVPCGRLMDNPSTPYNETDPCNLCHIFIMIQIVTSFVFEIGSIVAIFFLIIGGLIYATSAGNQGMMETGKKAITWALVGLAIIILSWLIVTIALTVLGYVDPLGGEWNIVDCSV